MRDHASEQTAIFLLLWRVGKPHYANRCNADTHLAQDAYLHTKAHLIQVAFRVSLRKHSPGLGSRVAHAESAKGRTSVASMPFVAASMRTRRTQRQGAAKDRTAGQLGALAGVPSPGADVAGVSPVNRATSR